MSNTQKLSIRLLRDGLVPANAVRDGVDLTPWDKLEGALIALATLGGGSPKWARFLELSEDDKKKVFRRSTESLRSQSSPRHVRMRMRSTRSPTTRPTSVGSTRFATSVSKN
jgi:hypothetical protein